ncbi:hypothetical protein CURTO8I2_80174 [Curtobacterium sp. 8I-2]|nr:hypothetical protein CURTO8I2_80174 [Curtobacterium sp. 8I-2]
MGELLMEFPVRAHETTPARRRGEPVVLGDQWVTERDGGSLWPG